MISAGCISRRCNLFVLPEEYMRHTSPNYILQRQVLMFHPVLLKLIYSLRKIPNFEGVQVENEKERISFDLRPSDAINIAVRCKVFLCSV